MTYTALNYATVAAFWAGSWGFGYVAGKFALFVRQIFEKL